jgi:hypothetical protein
VKAFRTRSPARSRRRLLGLSALVCALTAWTLAGGLPGGGAGKASGQATAAQEHFYTDDAVPANEVMMFGASPKEAPGETWGIGRAGQGGTPNYVIVRYVPGAGWTRGEPIRNSTGQQLEGFAPGNGALVGQMAPDGSGVLAGTVEKADVVLVRNPGKAFQETPVEPVAEAGEGLLRTGEQLFSTRAPLVAALEEGEGESARAGALVVPGNGAKAAHPEPAVLHWEGQSEHWTREPIKLPAGDSPTEFEPVAIAASSPANAWLLARVSANSEAVSLFRRKPAAEGSPASWEAVSPGEGVSKPAAGSPLTVAEQPVADESETVGQPLTVTGKGVWVDGKLAASRRVTLYFEPASTEADEGNLKASWCNVEGCTHPLPEPEELPLGQYRSFAWDESGEFGERVVTGFPDGVILRLQGDEFATEATVGAPAPPNDIGGSKGAAFSSATEGWLGNAELPVHATTELEEDQLEYWPAPFHEPLLAIAAQPGAPVGGIESEALAVGEGGEVARFVPHEGWQPESLFEVSGRRAETQLRAVAWPTPNRAYAIGARSEQFGVIGEMWLWRGETKLWEPDPAAPINLRASLLGIAFAPGEPARGYVVGQGGTLLRYGKTWTQEPTCGPSINQPCIPAEAAGASFTAVAFAGAEALVAYRVPHVTESSISYTGGVLANNGSGWRIDTEATSALPSGYVPWTVAGLPDGGAALSASVPGGNQEPVVLERTTASSSWEATAQPYPGYTAPASLALFREGGALRVVGSGAIPDTIADDYQIQPPAGFPPELTEPYAPGLATGVIRQTAAGWNDQEHERGILRSPLGTYVHWDMPYNPDPTAAILLNESGSEGWAVGGLHTTKPGSDAADLARYPATKTPPLGFGTSEIPLHEKSEEEVPHATFAAGGGAECAAPCAEMANARIGPDVWLRKAIERAKSASGVRAFIYTGPRVTTGAAIHPTLAIPYERELERFRGLLVESGGLEDPPVFVAAASTERELESECAFDRDLESFAPTVGKGECATGQSAYYSFVTQGGAGSPGERVIVIDDSGGVVGATQLAWLRQELEEGQHEALPPLVVGNADLGEESAKGEGNATEVIEALAGGGAAAYLYDAPEMNVATIWKAGNKSIHAFGSGTLGYIQASNSEQTDFIGASGFLLVEVEKPAKAPVQVKARLIPDIEELSLDAHAGTLLHRSEAALFSALARRPRAGGVATGASSENESANFIPIPANCQGVDCAEGILPEYRFSSSHSDIGQFVKPDLRSAEVNAVELEHEEPITDPRSGLFCAYNPGTTTVTIEAGGLSASLPVTVQAGSVRRPCGTTKDTEAPAKAQERAVATPPPPATAAPGGAAPAPLVPLPPAPAAVTPPALPPTPAPPLTTFSFAPSAGLLPTVIVPPPLPPAAEPTPPGGTSAVTSPVEAAQKEEEHEEATESVSAQAVAYRQSEQEPAPGYLLGLIALAAFGGATIRRRTRRGERELRVVPATISTIRSQRRMAPRRRRPW